MAKKGGKSSGAVSAGIHSSLNRQMVNNIRRDYMETSDRIMNQLKAFRAGKKVMVTMDNPNKNETNKPRVRVNARDVWKALPKNNGISS